jgi:hypothetical protein
METKKMNKEEKKMEEKRQQRQRMRLHKRVTATKPMKKMNRGLSLR